MLKLKITYSESINEICFHRRGILCKVKEIKELGGGALNRKALKIEFAFLKSKRYALCAMRYAVFPAQNTAHRENSQLRTETTRRPSC
jgi:hypothetical protein